MTQRMLNQRTKAGNIKNPKIQKTKLKTQNLEQLQSQNIALKNLETNICYITLKS